MSAADLIGYVAGVLTTASFLPQVVKTWRSGSARDLSLMWLAAFATGVGLWLVYGILLGAVPIIVPNVITFSLLMVLVALKLRRPGA